MKEFVDKMVEEFESIEGRIMDNDYWPFAVFLAEKLEAAHNQIAKHLSAPTPGQESANAVAGLKKSEAVCSHTFNGHDYLYTKCHKYFPETN